MKYLIFISILLLLIVGYLFWSYPRGLKAVDNLDKAIAEAVEKGDYSCCIDPPCRMCFMGEWVFEKGTCDCDQYIGSGEMDKVCPECKHGIEEGECESQKGSCQIEL